MYTLSIIAPVVALGAMGLFFGLLLAVSSKIFHVEQDERLPQITEGKLPATAALWADRKRLPKSPPSWVWKPEHRTGKWPM